MAAVMDKPNSISPYAVLARERVTKDLHERAQAARALRAVEYADLLDAVVLDEDNSQDHLEAKAAIAKHALALLAYRDAIRHGLDTYDAHAAVVRTQRSLASRDEKQEAANDADFAAAAMRPAAASGVLA